MSKKLIVPLVAALFLGACASDPPSWRKAGITPDDAESMLAQCKFDVGVKNMSDTKEKELVQNCMQAKGFRWRTY